MDSFQATTKKSKWTNFISENLELYSIELNVALYNCSPNG